MPLHYLPDTGPKLVEDVDARVAANGQGKSFGCRRSGARPIWAVSSGDRDRRQHPKEIRRVHCRLSRVIPRDYRARSCVHRTTPNARAARMVIARVLLEKCWIEVLTKEGARLFLNERPFIQFGQAGFTSGTKASHFGQVHYACVDASRSECQRRARFIDERTKFLPLSWRLW